MLLIGALEQDWVYRENKTYDHYNNIIVGY